MARPLSTAKTDIPVLTFEAFFEQVRAVGVDVHDTSVPLMLPLVEADQWALLKPYLGQPLKAIPKGLILLFTSKAAERTPRDVAQAIRALPARERQARPDTKDEEIFI